MYLILYSTIRFLIGKGRGAGLNLSMRISKRLKIISFCEILVHVEYKVPFDFWPLISYFVNVPWPWPVKWLAMTCVTLKLCIIVKTKFWRQHILEILKIYNTRLNLTLLKQAQGQGYTTFPNPWKSESFLISQQYQ